MLITKQSVSEAHVAAMMYSDNSTVTPGAASYGQRYCSDVMGGASSNARKRTIPDSDDSDDDGAGVGVTLRARGPSTYQRVRQVLDRAHGVVPTDDFVALDGAPEQASSASQRQVEEEEDAAARAASLDTYAAEQRAAQGKVCCMSRIAARARAALLTLASARTSQAKRMVSTEAECADDDDDDEAGEDEEMNDSDRDFLDDRSEDELSYVSSENGSA